jgi:enoyl-CoA hydratase/carnithine racemase
LSRLSSILLGESGESHPVPAEDALAMGFINEIVPRERLLDRAFVEKWKARFTGR